MKTFVLSLLLFSLIIPLIASEWIVSPNRAIPFHMLAFSPDGKLVAISDGENVQLWTSDFKHMVRYFFCRKYGRKPLSNIQFSSDSKYIILGGDSVEPNFARINIENGEIVYPSIKAFYPVDNEIYFVYFMKKLENSWNSMENIVIPPYFNWKWRKSDCIITPDLEYVLMMRDSTIHTITIASQEVSQDRLDQEIHRIWRYPYHQITSGLIPLQYGNDTRFWDYRKHSFTPVAIPIQNHVRNGPSYRWMINSRIYIEEKENIAELRNLETDDLELLLHIPWMRTKLAMSFNNDRSLFLAPSSYERRQNMHLPPFIILDRESGFTKMICDSIPPITGVCPSSSDNEIVFWTVDYRVFRYTFNGNSISEISIPNIIPDQSQSSFDVSPFARYIVFGGTGSNILADFHDHNVIARDIPNDFALFNQKENRLLFSDPMKERGTLYRIADGQRLEEVWSGEMISDQYFPPQILEKYIVFGNYNEITVVNIETDSLTHCNFERDHRWKYRYTVSTNERWIAVIGKEQVFIFDLYHLAAEPIVIKQECISLGFIDKNRLLAYLASRKDHSTYYRMWDIPSLDIIESRRTRYLGVQITGIYPVNYYHNGNLVFGTAVEDMLEPDIYYYVLNRENPDICHNIGMRTDHAFSRDFDNIIGYTKIYQGESLSFVGSLHYDQITSCDYSTQISSAWFGNFHIHPHFNRNGSRIVTEGLSGEFFLFDSTSGEHLASLIYVKNGTQWLAYTPDGHYDGTADPTIYLSMVNGLDAKPFDTKDGTMRVPGLWKTLMESE